MTIASASRTAAGGGSQGDRWTSVDQFFGGPAAIGLEERSIGASFAKRAPGDAMPVPQHDSSTDPVDFTGPYVLLAARDQSGRR